MLNQKSKNFQKKDKFGLKKKKINELIKKNKKNKSPKVIMLMIVGIQLRIIFH